MKIKTIVYAVLLGVSAFSQTIFAQDCGWETLSIAEKQNTREGQTTLRSDFSRGIESFTIEQYAFTGSPSVFDATAHFFNITAYPDVSIVEKTTLTIGESVSNNPVRLDVTPQEGNPFGKLYQPFTYEVSVNPVRSAYVIKIDYLTSPNLVKDLQSTICIARIENRVFMSYLSHFEGNPKIGFQTPGFGTAERTALWQAVFKSALERTSLPKSMADNDVLTKALLGQLD